MNDQPSNREIYTAILDLRGRMEALAWDLTAIEERIDRFANRGVRCGMGEAATERCLARVEEDFRTLCRLLEGRIPN